MQNKILSILGLFAVTLWVIIAIIFPYLSNGVLVSWMMYSIPLLVGIVAAFFSQKLISTLSVLLAFLTPIVQVCWSYYLGINPFYSEINLGFNFWGLNGYIVFIVIIPLFFFLLERLISSPSKKS